MSEVMLSVVELLPATPEIHPGPVQTWRVASAFVARRGHEA